MKKNLILWICALTFYNTFSQIKTCEDIIFPTLNSSLYQGIYHSDYKWPNSKTISVHFLNGSNYLRNRVISYANEWTDYANIKFEIVDFPSADIRISFYQGKGSWSLIGINSLEFSVDINTLESIPGKTGPSMNFGWFNDDTEESEIRRTTLHEFGHALGLLHEHLNPLSGIKWNKPRVYAHYIQTQNWTKQMVDKNIFQKYSVTQTNGEYDPHSIMHYPVDSKFTLNSYSVGMNYVLSNGDKNLISSLYKSGYQEDENYVVNNVNYRITNVTYGDGIWALVMSKRGFNYSQSYIYRNYFPENEIREAFEEKGRYITDVSYGNGHWNFVMSDDTDGFEQVFFGRGYYPKKLIKKRMQEGFSLTELVYGNGIWFATMNRLPYVSDQVIKRYKYYPSGKEIDKYRNKGYSVSQFEFLENDCFVVYTKDSRLIAQSVRVTRFFPKEEILQHWKNGYAITELKFANNLWYLVMIQGTGITEQSWATRTEFPSNEIAELWDK